MVARRNRAVTVLTGVLALVVVPALAAPASAGATTTGVTARPTGTAGTLSPGEAASRIMLITGDVVEVTPAGDGRFAAAIRPGPGRGRTSRSTPSRPTAACGCCPATWCRTYRPACSTPTCSTYPADRRRVRRRAQRHPPADRAVRPDPREGGRHCHPAGHRQPADPGEHQRPAVQEQKDRADDFWARVGGHRTRHRQDDRGRGCGTQGLAGRQGRGRPRPTASRRSAPRRPGRPATTAPASRWRCWTPASTPSHPDLAGQVVAAANFSDRQRRDRPHGHGTHVASTVAGTGAASGGTTRASRPAPSCSTARCSTTPAPARLVRIIAGMEWAAAQGAESST